MGSGRGGVICVLGDAHLDVVVCAGGPVAEETDTPARTSVGVGGQAANVAAWVVALGGRARLIAARGTDLASRLVAGELARRAVDLVGPVIDGRTGVVVSLTDGAATRSMLTDRGVGPELAARPAAAGLARRLRLAAPAGLQPGRRAGRGRGARRRRARAAAEHRPVLDRGRCRPTALERFAELIARLRPDVVFGNEAEAALVGDVPGAELVVKLGARGVRVAGTVFPALPTRPVDSTGAGDAFAAGYLVGGITLGLEAAARAVATMGAMP